nr:reverse transcriptase-like protein [Serratia marcescens]
RGIEIDPSKIKAITEMPPPTNLRQLRALQGKLAYIRRFIANLSRKCQPFSHLMKKNTPFIWDEKCQKAFDNIKQYLANPPVLAAPITGKPLILYTAVTEESLGALLAQNNEEGKENALYYLSRRLHGAEFKYSLIEKYCLSLILAVQKLRHYLLAHEVTLISRVDPLKHLLQKPILSGRLAKWAVILLEFTIAYAQQKAIKGQALADFLAAHPLPADVPANFDLPDEEVLYTEDNVPVWKMYFDGASSAKTIPGEDTPRIRAGIGLVFISPEGGIIYHSFSLTEPRTNNEAEYEALIAGLEIAHRLQVKCLHVYGDSQLVVRQVCGEYQVIKPELIKYKNRVDWLVNRIQLVTLESIPRCENSEAFQRNVRASRVCSC